MPICLLEYLSTKVDYALWQGSNVALVEARIIEINKKGGIIMQTVKFKVSELNNEYMEKTILQKLKGLDGVLDVSVDRKAEEVSISVADPAVCEGVFCLIEDLGFKVHRP